jgi:hypothetical protein
MSLENTGAPSGVAEGAAASTTSTEKPKSIEETLRNGYKDAMSKAPLDEVDDEGTAEAGIATANKPADGRVRGLDGKFVKSTETQPNSVTAKPNSVTEGAESATAAAPVATETPPATAKPHDTPPNTWTKEAKANWATLPESARQEIHRREADFHKGIGQYKDAAGFGSQMAQELLPFQEAINKAGIHPREIIKTLGPVWNTLTTGTPEEKTQVLLRVAKDFGINIAAAGSETSQPSTAAPQADPIVAALQQELKEIKGHLTTKERERAEAEYSAEVERVNAWGSDPKRPHFNVVREDMGILIETGRAKDLQDAYDKAIWINPEVRASLLAEQEKERVAKEAEQAAAARKAAGANVTRRGTPPVSAKPGSIEDTLRSGLRRLNGG